MIIFFIVGNKFNWDRKENAKETYLPAEKLKYERITTL